MSAAWKFIIQNSELSEAPVFKFASKFALTIICLVFRE